MSAPQSGIQRQHELDALRAFAMLLGIALHGSLAYMRFPWIVQDLHSNFGFEILFCAIHGFRMPLFMLVSGYFTMMLWRRRGLAALLKQRTLRVFVPCMLGLVTILPALNGAKILAATMVKSQNARIRNEKAETPERIDQAKGVRYVSRKAPDPWDGSLQSTRAHYKAFLDSERFVIRARPNEPGFGLFQTEIFGHLWFLWQLCWLVLFFALFVLIGSLLRIPKFPSVWILSPARWLWLLPLTLVPQLLMGIMMPSFGPDTSASLLPQPHVLFYYALFFSFGALYFDCDDAQGRLTQWWRLEMGLALLVALPLALLTHAENHVVELPWKLSVTTHMAISGFFQAIYVWAMSIGLMGLFRTYLSRETKALRYLSDSAYWLYLSHLPLMVIVQAWVRPWPVNTFFKFAVVCILTTVPLLIAYQYLVRYTWVGRLLNGPRQRPKSPSETLSLSSSPTVASHS